MRYVRSVLIAWFAVSAADAVAVPRFEVSVNGRFLPAAESGRLMVVLARKAEPEPRTTIGQTGMDSSIVLAIDARLMRGSTAVVDGSAYTFPVRRATDIPAGEYIVQALFDFNIDLKSVNAPGNLYSRPQPLLFDPLSSQTVTIELSEQVPPEELPADQEFVRFLRIKSELLSQFHGRPIFLRAGVILPKDWATDPSREFPLRVHIGGYGSRYTGVNRMMAAGTPFRQAWESEGAPSMILLHLDGDGPYGDPYQLNSANHGPYGDALTRELIPQVEQHFRGIGEPYARVLDGGSTGGWVSLALQVFYPDFFNGAWSSCPDGVDFRAFQLINVYEDTNAYVNKHGFERPSARDLSGDVRFTMRHECQMENMMAPGSNWAMSGGQWGAWNATYGPRGADSKPQALWDPETGAIDRTVAEHWKKYDLRMVMEQNWKTLGPKLRGKLNVWMGEADNYFLNNALHLLGEFFEKAEPAPEARIFYDSRRGHCWTGITPRQMMDEMLAAVNRSRK